MSSALGRRRRFNLMIFQGLILESFPATFLFGGDSFALPPLAASDFAYLLAERLCGA
jgi:hypothetical protein